MGPVQMKKREESEIDSLVDEIEAHCQNNDLEHHSCNIAGHEHEALPMVKGSYG